MTHTHTHIYIHSNPNARKGYPQKEATRHVGAHTDTHNPPEECDASFALLLDHSFEHWRELIKCHCEIRRRPYVLQFMQEDTEGVKDVGLSGLGMPSTRRSYDFVPQWRLGGAELIFGLPEEHGRWPRHRLKARPLHERRCELHVRIQRPEKEVLEEMRNGRPTVWSPS